jgi:hypothetical protein
MWLLAAAKAAVGSAVEIFTGSQRTGSTVASVPAPEQRAVLEGARRSAAAPRTARTAPPPRGGGLPPAGLVSEPITILAAAKGECEWRSAVGVFATRRL